MKLVPEWNRVISSRADKTETPLAKFTPLSDGEHFILNGEAQSFRPFNRGAINIGIPREKSASFSSTVSDLNSNIL